MISIKTIVPRRQDHWLPRQRLLDLLLPAEGMALSLVSAPAGHGKTTLLADMAHQAPFPVCWFSLDALDCDLYTFINGLIIALQRRFLDFGQLTRQALNAGTGRELVNLAGIIAQDMREKIPGRFALVLDDYDQVDGSLEISELLYALVEQRPEHFYLVVGCDRPPMGLPIIQLTAREQIVFIGQEPLSFNVDETQALLEKMSPAKAPPEQAQRIVARHQGHATYTLLSIALLASGGPRPGERGRAEAPPALDYAELIAWAFMQEPEPLRDTLMTLSTLREMSDARCQEALGMTGVGMVLQGLRHQDIFITTVFDQHTNSTWYRFHPPIRDFLQAQLQARDNARFRKLHQRAADWLEACDDCEPEYERWERAVTHRLAAGDVHATARTMADGAATMFYAGRAEALINWYDEIPGSLRPGFPILLLFVARAMIVLGRTGEAMPLLHQTEALFKQRGDAERALFAILERANVRYAWGHYADTLARAREVLEQAVDYPEPSAEAHRLAGLAYLELGQPQDAVEHLRAALTLCQKLSLLQETAVSYVNLSLALNRQGKLGESLDCLEQAIKLLRQVGPSNHLAMALNNVAHERYYLAGDYVQAQACLREALDVARLTGSSREQVFAMLSTADLYRDLGAVQEARELYAQARELARQAGHTALVNYALLGDSLALLRDGGDVVEAMGMASQALDQARGREDIYQLGLSYLALGLAHLETGDLSAALQEIERGRDWLEQSGARRDLTRAYVLQARALQVCGDQGGALEALCRALEVGIETQTFHHLVVEGQRVFDLFRRLRGRNQSDQRAARIMDRIRVLPDAARDAIGGVAPTALPYTPRLRLYGFGPGRAEIDGHVVPTAAWQSRTPRRLIFYLLLHAPCSLEHILEVFWPGVDKNSARPTFHVIKQRVNRALGRRMIIYIDDQYHVAWDPDCWFDVGAFESLLNGRDGRLARLQAAIALYQGDFMNDYDAEWCCTIRIHLNMRYRNALVELGELYLEQGEFAEGFSVLCRATPMDNLYEPASRALMRLYASDGRRDSALRHYESLQGYLRRDVGTVPDARTQSLHAAIQAGASAAQLAELARTFPSISAWRQLL